MYKTILLAVDLEEESSWTKALPTAVALARAFGSSLHVMTVVPTFMPAAAQLLPPDYEEKMVRDASERLREFVKTRAPADLEAHCDIAHGMIYEEVLNRAKEIGADLVVMASHRPELKDYLIGPNASRVVRHANCSVMVVRD